ncbi:type 1 glutamine amidotransferase domain-containing protein [Vogesella sp. LYT5W]|uniref:Type 1 glutamine amidotransferase domain-containing protein n=1 Tax=Vogesella margarita TaxID=2984199 RepID=A0ABT5ISH4_9NEIS|nr:type 1 glutamine amidotransferase domain-containing protein [Vogesella margarita]MDC7715514.1 type 1 glutamine amidotransferase domain-containing protein [Vogesella margarita]
MKHVLFVLTSHDRLGDSGHKTGFWIEEFAAPYYALADAGVAITLASPRGGQPPIDPKSADPAFGTPATERFNADATLQARLAETLPLDSIDASHYDAVFYPGGHGPLWDLVDNADSQRLIAATLAAGKPVAAVCHAPAVMVNVVDADGKALVGGKRVTGFSNSEEEAVQLTSIVPLLLEDALQARGARYEKGPDWAPFVVEDGLLITGQNPASSEAVAHALLARLDA